MYSLYRSQPYSRTHEQERKVDPNELHRDLECRLRGISRSPSLGGDTRTQAATINGQFAAARWRHTCPGRCSHQRAEHFFLLFYSLLKMVVWSALKIRKLAILDGAYSSSLSLFICLPEDDQNGIYYYIGIDKFKIRTAKLFRDNYIVSSELMKSRAGSNKRTECEPLQFV